MIRFFMKKLTQAQFTYLLILYTSVGGSSTNKLSWSKFPPDGRANALIVLFDRNTIQLPRSMNRQSETN